MNAWDPEDSRTLGLLQVIEAQSDVSQRSIARRLGVALGLANLYLKRCVRKGWVKVSAAPANRYLYYLTPTGFAEKARLTAQFLSVSLHLYREIGQEITEILDQCSTIGLRAIVLAGYSELAELAVIRAHGKSVRIVGVFDPATKAESCVGVCVFADLDSIPNHDAYVLTSLSDPTTLLRTLRTASPSTRIFSPSAVAVQIDTTDLPNADRQTRKRIL